MDGKLSEVDRGVRLWLRLVGDFEAHLDSCESALPVSKKARALLALITAHMPQPIRRDFAAGLLWSSKPKEYAANSLRQALRELQIALAVCGSPPIILTGGGRLCLDGRAVWIDVHDLPPSEWGMHQGSGIGHLLLCQNLAGLDPALDRHFDRLWKNLVFQNAFVPPADEGAASYGARPTPNPALLAQPILTSASPTRPAQPIEPSPQRPAVNTAAVQQAVQAPGWRIAVLPFRCLGASASSGLSLGLAEEISAALAKFRMPRLVATSSFYDQAGPTADALARCRAFNLDYVIDGMVQVCGPRVRVTVNLLDVAKEFEVIWTSRFDGQFDDLFSLQDTIASQTVAQIDPELLQRHRFTNDRAAAPVAEAHQAVLSAIWSIYRLDKVRFFKARAELDRAIKLDPTYAAAHAWLAYWYVCGMAGGWIGDPERAIAQAGKAAERAIELDPLDARGLTIAGHVKAYLQHDLDAALALHDRAITLNPNLPIARTLSSWALVYRGDHQRAVQQATRAEALSPADPHIFAVEHAAMAAKFFLGDLDSADRLALRSLERRPRHATALKVRLATLGHLGRRNDAAECMALLRATGVELAVDPIISRPPLRQADRDFYAAGLRLAGVRG